MQLFGYSSTWNILGNDAFIRLVGGLRDVSVGIVRECTGIQVFAIFSGLVLPVKGGLWLRKGLSLVIAGPVLFIMNISRVVLTILLTAYDVPPFVWIIVNPTIETYHYLLSVLFGIVGVALLVVIISKWTLPELGETLIRIPHRVKTITRPVIAR
jgi:exosortase/archaeosortase family protein